MSRAGKNIFLIFGESLRFLSVILLLILAGEFSNTVRASSPEKPLIPSVPASSAAGTQSFKDFIERGLLANPSVLTEAERLSASEKKFYSKSFFWTPDVDVKFDRQLKDPNVDGSAVSVSLNLSKFGSDLASYRSSLYSLRAQRSRQAWKRLEAELELAELVFQYLLTKSQVEFQSESLRIRQRAHDIAREKYRRGQSPEQDVVRTRIEMQDAELTLAERKEALIRKLDEIQLQVPGMNATVLGWPWLSHLSSSRVQDILKQFGASSANESSSNLDAPSANQPRALNLDIAENESLASRQSYWSSKLSYWPRLDFTTSWVAAGHGLGQTGTWNASIGLTFPIWNKMANYAESRALLAEYRILEIQRTRLSNSLRISDNSLSGRFEIRREAAQKAQESLKLTKSLLEDSLRRFELGRASLNDVFLDQSRLAQAEVSAQSALANFHRILVEVCHRANESLTQCY